MRKQRKEGRSDVGRRLKNPILFINSIAMFLAMLSIIRLVYGYIINLKYQVGYD